MGRNPLSPPTFIPVCLHLVFHSLVTLSLRQVLDGLLAQCGTVENCEQGECVPPLLHHSLTMEYQGHHEKRKI